MPTRRQYATPAERQAAYRARRNAESPSTGSSLPPRPGYRRWAVLLAHIRRLLSTIREEMADYREQRSEVWHDSERGALFTEQEEALEEIYGLLNDLPMSER